MLLRLVLIISCGLLAACATTRVNSQAEADRRDAIAAEPRGAYFVARRFFIDHTHFWGYVRRPGESWDRARLTIMNERYCRIPDRLPENTGNPGSAGSYGFNHNYEYHLWGEYTGRKVFDPNSNMVLPEFMLRSYKLVNERPGFLFRSNERFNGSQLLRAEPGSLP